MSFIMMATTDLQMTSFLHHKQDNSLIENKTLLVSVMVVVHYQLNEYYVSLCMYGTLPFMLDFCFVMDFV